MVTNYTNRTQYSCHSIAFVLFVMGSTMDEHSPEVITAIRATIIAAELCQRVRKDLAGGESILKGDRSPVTVADFGSQAVICQTDQREIS